jgi:intracellular multiplication protein IcmV
MAGRIKRVGKKLGGTVSKLFGLKMVGMFFGYTKEIAKKTMIPQKSTFTETFEEAIARMHLKEEDLKAQQKKFIVQAMWFFAFALPVLGYSVYMGYTGLAYPCFVSFIIAMMLFAHAFRAHFWAFQIKHRKLGCSFSEWFNGKIKEE